MSECVCRLVSLCHERGSLYIHWWCLSDQEMNMQQIHTHHEFSFISFICLECMMGNINWFWERAQRERATALRGEPTETIRLLYSHTGDVVWCLIGWSDIVIVVMTITHRWVFLVCYVIPEISIRMCCRILSRSILCLPAVMLWSPQSHAIFRMSHNRLTSSDNKGKIREWTHNKNLL